MARTNEEQVKSYKANLRKRIASRWSEYDDEPSADKREALVDEIDALEDDLANAD